MKYDGIDGAVTAAGHEKWIELQSCQLGVNRHINTPTGRGANREASAPTVSEIVVTKSQDCASTLLFRASLDGEGKKVKIDFCKTDKDKFEPYLQVELENTMISSFTVSGAGGDTHDRPMESLSLSFTSMQVSSTAMDASNKTGKPARAKWDAATGKAS
jgi:type VI secretion system secreted protein Hcp